MSPDSELVQAYVVEGSEPAFSALVRRHANLVYATALRQVGDRGIAEEITQNVFIELGKKAPRLVGVETLAGWLHRTAVFQSRTRIRSELRRRVREEKAAAFAAVDREADSSLETFVPLVDEALLHLRESDRIALVLRFFEDRSLREVGGALGVDEDAARKRVSRALGKVMSFFGERGFTLPAGVSAAGLLTGSTQAAPATLITMSTKAALSAGGAASGLNLLLFHLMNIGTKKAVIGCALLVLAPLLWQGHLQARFEGEQPLLTGRLNAMEKQLQDLESKKRGLDESIAVLVAQTETAQVQLAALSAQRTGKVQPPTYQWDDDSPYMRVPVGFLKDLPPAVTYTNDKIHIDATTAEFLQMSPVEIEQTEAVLQAFSDTYQDALSKNIRRVEPTELELNGRTPERIRAFEVPAMADEIKQFRQTLFGQLQGILGNERFPKFRNSLDDWMPIDDVEPGLRRSRGVLPFAHRMVFYEPANDAILYGAPALGFRQSAEDRGRLTGHIPLDQIPRAFASELQDWMELSRRQFAGHRTE